MRISFYRGVEYILTREFDGLDFRNKRLLGVTRDDKGDMFTLLAEQQDDKTWLLYDGDIVVDSFRVYGVTPNE